MGEVASPTVIDVTAEVRSITERDMALVYRNYAIFLKRTSKSSRSFRASVWVDEDGAIKPVASGEFNSPYELESRDLPEDVMTVIKYYVDMWDLLLEQKQAEILLRGRIKVIPKGSTDKELLAEQLATTILNDITVKTFYVRSGGKEVELGIYCYDGDRGIYFECEESLEHKMEEMLSYHELKLKATNIVISEALGKIRRRTWEEFRPEKRKLIFYNKVFDWDIFIETGDLARSLFDPSPDTIVTHWIPHRINIEKLMQARKGLEKYIPPSNENEVLEVFKALAPKSYQAFLSWVKYPEESEEDAKFRVLLILEMIGYTLDPYEYPYNKAFLLVGEGNNGKTTLLRLIKKILGEHNVSSVNLRNLDPRVNRFAAAELYGKLANISAEPVNEQIGRGGFDPSLFKQLTGEDLITIERKFKDPFQAVNYAKLIFSANRLPEVAEDTYAFWRRWIVIEFPNEFPPDDAFFERTFTEDEIEGIVISALYAFRLVKKRKGFTEKGAKDPKEEWMRRSNDVYRVVKSMIDEGIIELDKDGWIEKKDLYTLYLKYAEKLEEEEGEDIQTVAQKTFTEKIAQLFGIRSGQKWYGGKKYNAYLGVKIKDWEKAVQLAGQLSTPRSAQGLSQFIGGAPSS